MNKKILRLVSMLIILTLVIGLSLTSCAKKKEEKEVKEVIKIGAILPLTGDLGLYGENTVKGMLVAKEICNDSLMKDGKSIEIVFEDNKGNAKDAVMALRKLVNSGIKYIVDDAVSTITLSLVPVCDEHQVVLLSTGASAPSLSGTSKFFFRIWNSDIEEGRYIAQVISKLGYKVIDVIYINNDYGNELSNVFVRNLKENLKVKTYPFSSKQKDFKSVLSKLRADNPEAIYVIGYAPNISIVVKTLKELGIKGVIFSTVAAEDQSIIENIGKLSDNIIYPYPETAKGDYYKLFKSKYEEKYGEKPPILSDVGFDAVILFYKAVVNGMYEDSKDIVEYLRNMDEFYGASGKIKFDKNGDVHKPMILKRIYNGKFEQIDIDFIKRGIN